MTGRFVWHELMTTDSKAAIAFYSEVIGWNTQPFADASGPDPYTMWVSSEGPLGGVMTLPEAARSMGVPPHWMGHVSVADVDATVAKIKSLGGTVHLAPKSIEKVGRFSIVADPQGASLSVFTSEQPMRPHDTTKHGEVSWNELYANDAPAAFKFYSEVFGWALLQEMDMGAHGKYLIYGKGDKQYGGMMTKTPDMPFPPTWSYYIHVDDLNATIGRATSKGAKVTMGPMEVPGGDHVAMLTDPQGAAFALHAK